MSETVTGWQLVVLTSIVSAGLVHALLPRYFTASIVAAVLTVAIFVIISRIELGYMDAFIPIAMLICFPVAWVIALLFGLPFALGRQWLHMRGELNK